MMGHSFIEYRGKDVLLHDRDILVAVCVLVDVVRHTAELQSLEPVFQRWIEIINTSGVGCIDLQLDECLRDPRRVDSVRRALILARQRAHDFGAVVPDDLPNTLLGRTGMLALRSYPAGNVEETLDELARLVAPDDL